MALGTSPWLSRSLELTEAVLRAPLALQSTAQSARLPLAGQHQVKAHQGLPLALVEVALEGCVALTEALLAVGCLQAAREGHFLGLLGEHRVGSGFQQRAWSVGRSESLPSLQRLTSGREVRHSPTRPVEVGGQPLRRVPLACHPSQGPQRASRPSLRCGVPVPWPERGASRQANARGVSPCWACRKTKPGALKGRAVWEAACQLRGGISLGGSGAPTGRGKTSCPKGFVEGSRGRDEARKAALPETAAGGGGPLPSRGMPTSWQSPGARGWRGWALHACTAPLLQAVRLSRNKVPKPAPGRRALPLPHHRAGPGQPSSAAAAPWLNCAN